MNVVSRGLVCAFVLAACNAPTRSEEKAPPPAASSAPASGETASSAPTGDASSAPSVSVTSSPTTEETADVASGAAASASTAAPPPVVDPHCPADMVYVAGKYCPNVRQHCVEYAKEWANERRRLGALAEHGEKGKTTASEVCLRYEEPSECLSKERRDVAVCVDRYEWPNQKGAIPDVLVDWYEAKKQCESVGKRLCTEVEFNFACEGEAMLPYSYGYERAPEKCHLDKPYKKRERKLKRLKNCLGDATCKAELERLDQREPAGSRPECHSPFGVYDINGNVNEWVELLGKKTPDRSGLKGGWWGPVRSRCRPTVTFHKESDYGYEAGFRCCRDPQAN